MNLLVIYLSLSLSLILTLTHSHSLAHSLTHSLTRSLTHSLTHSLSHTHLHSFTLTLSVVEVIFHVYGEPAAQIVRDQWGGKVRATFHFTWKDHSCIHTPVCLTHSYTYTFLHSLSLPPSLSLSLSPSPSLSLGRSLAPHVGPERGRGCVHGQQRHS